MEAPVAAENAASDQPDPKTGQVVSDAAEQVGSPEWFRRVGVELAPYHTPDTVLLATGRAHDAGMTDGEWTVRGLYVHGTAHTECEVACVAQPGDAAGIAWLGTHRGWLLELAGEALRSRAQIAQISMTVERDQLTRDKASLAERIAELEAQLADRDSQIATLRAARDSAHTEPTYAQLRAGVSALAAMVDQTDPDDPIGVALTLAGLADVRAACDLGEPMRGMDDPRWTGGNHAELLPMGGDR